MDTLEKNLKISVDGFQICSIETRSSTDVKQFYAQVSHYDNRDITFKWSSQSYFKSILRGHVKALNIVDVEHWRDVPAIREHFLQ